MDLHRESRDGGKVPDPFTLHLGGQTVYDEQVKGYLDP